MIIVLAVLQLFDVIDLDFDGNSNGTSFSSDFSGDGFYYNNGYNPHNDDEDDDYYNDNYYR